MPLLKLPVHTRKASALRYEQDDGQRVIVVTHGPGFEPGSVLNFRGMKVTLQYTVGLCYPDPGDSFPSERLWSSIVGKVDTDTGEEPKVRQSAVKRLQRKGSIPVRRRRKLSGAPAKRSR